MPPSVANFPRRVFPFLLRPHPLERARDIRFQEEARAERLANLIRTAYLLAWLAASAAYAPDNDPAFNRINLGLGGVWCAASLAYHAALARRAYRPFLKYASTAFDLAVSTALIAAYAEAAGPAFALKMPIFLNYFCCLGLAALRFRRGLALYAAGFAAGLFLLLWLWLDARHGIAYGDSFAHAASGKIHGNFLADQALYLMVFGLLLVAAAINVRRLVGLRVAEGERAAREQERALMAVGLAHEIRNPLEGIYGAAQLLRDEGRGTARFTDMILADARRLNGVLEGFLRYARPFPVRPEPVDLAELARSFCREQSRLFPESPLDCACPGSPLPVRTDPEAVRQILLNLVQNARKVQPPGVPIRLRAEKRGNAICVGVEDAGPGIPEAIHERLFEPFRTSSGGGTGLGLALSRRIARALGGDLTHEPLRPGARFVLMLGNLSGGPP